MLPSGLTWVKLAITEVTNMSALLRPLVDTGVHSSNANFPRYSRHRCLCDGEKAASIDKTWVSVYFVDATQVSHDLPCFRQGIRHRPFLDLKVTRLTYRLDTHLLY